MNTILAKMAVQIAANTAEFSKGLNQASGSLNKFKADVTAVGTALVTAFSIKEIADFVLEANKLAGTFEGVQRAFQRLPNSTLLMENLRESTHGTVDNLMLMQQALRARNFGISVKDLGTYLEFAAIRAQQTGESIDYMVNSIILGLGRGSIKILDNLQVNIAKIKETVKETGVSLQEAFRQQVVEQMQTIGGYAETAATQVDRLQVAIKALKLETSKRLESSGGINFIQEMADAARLLVKSFDSNPDSIIWFDGKTLLKISKNVRLEEIEQAAVKRAKVFTESLKGNLSEQEKAVQQQINSIKSLLLKRNSELIGVEEEYQKALKTIKEKQHGFTQDEGSFAFDVENGRLGGGAVSTQALQRLVNMKNSMLENINIMQRELSLLKEYQTTTPAASAETKNLGITLQFLNDELELLNKQFEEKTNVKDAKELDNIGKKIKALKDQIAEINKLREAQKGLKLEFIFDPSEENASEFDPNWANDNEANALKKSLDEMMALGKTAEITGGALVKLGDPMNDFKKTAKEVVDISGLVSGGIIDIANAFGEAATGSINFGDAILRSLANFAQQFGAILVATGVGKVAFEKFSGPAMIVAGASLVALGSAVRGVISNRPNISSGGSGGNFGFGNVPNASNPYSLFYENGSRQPSIFLEARGTSLVSVTNEQGRRDARIRANSRRLS